jgi:hypothetical protein
LGEAPEAEDELRWVGGEVGPVTAHRVQPDRAFRGRGGDGALVSSRGQPGDGMDACRKSAQLDARGMGRERVDQRRVVRRRSGRAEAATEAPNRTAEPASNRTLSPTRFGVILALANVHTVPEGGAAMSNQTHTPTVADLAPLIGTWRMDVEFPDGRQGPPRDMGARTVFEYGPGSQFLIQRWQVPHPEAPDGIAIITTDSARGAFLQHYFDSRGVVRLYEMAFADRIWTLERAKPDFSPLDFFQRWEAKLSAEGQTIRGRWLDRTANEGWSHDFALTYTRVG